MKRSCRHTVPDLTVKIEVKDRIAKNTYFRCMFWASGALIVCPEIKQKQEQDRKTHFETVSLPVAETLSAVARQAPTKGAAIILM